MDAAVPTYTSCGGSRLGGSTWVVGLESRRESAGGRLHCEPRYERWRADVEGAEPDSSTAHRRGSVADCKQLPWALALALGGVQGKSPHNFSRRRSGTRRSLRIVWCPFRCAVWRVRADVGVSGRYSDSVPAPRAIMRIRIWLWRGLTLWGSLLMTHESSWSGRWGGPESQATSPALRAPAPHAIRAGATFPRSCSPPRATSRVYCTVPGERSAQNDIFHIKPCPCSETLVYIDVQYTYKLPDRIGEFLQCHRKL